VIRTQATSTIITEINAYMGNFSNANSDWYVGVTSDVEGRLFGYHNVSKQNGAWIYRYASNSDEAREIEAAYHTANHGGIVRAGVVVFVGSIDAGSINSWRHALSGRQL
jgi:hypothetical protein